MLKEHLQYNKMHDYKQGYKSYHAENHLNF